jgi:hypothetical protein
MIRLFSKAKTKMQISIRYLLSIFLLCAAVVIGIGSSSLRADADPRFQNEAQTQHAQNIAIEAAFQDQDVIAAKNSGNYALMNELVDEKVAEFMQQISQMRVSGMGWGNIARKLEVHPRFIGLGHSKTDAKYDTAFTKSSDNGKAKGLALGHDKDCGEGRGIGNGGSKGGGNGGGRGGGRK